MMVVLETFRVVVPQAVSIPSICRVVQIPPIWRSKLLTFKIYTKCTTRMLTQLMTSIQRWIVWWGHRLLACKVKVACWVGLGRVSLNSQSSPSSPWWVKCQGFKWVSSSNRLIRWVSEVKALCSSKSRASSQMLLEISLITKMLVHLDRWQGIRVWAREWVQVLEGEWDLLAEAWVISRCNSNRPKYPLSTPLKIIKIRKILDSREWTKASIVSSSLPSSSPRQDHLAHSNLLVVVATQLPLRMCMLMV